ncbi:MAG: polysaccharide lyase family 7 protein [Bacteroidota bacterium]
MNVICYFLGLRKINGSFSPASKGLLLLLLCTALVSPATAQELDPNLPPGGNFNLSCWKLTRPNQQEKDESLLSNGYVVEGEFYTDSITGAMVFWCPNDGLTGGSTYPRNELREMMRCGDNSIGTQGINKNNWVFSSSTLENQQAAAGVDGILTATVAVDHVSETSDASFKVGRTIVGQIHASDDEPCRIYYRKLPGNTKGSIYFAHEPTTGSEQWYEMIGSRSDNAPDPEDGVVLGEQFSYEIKAIGNLLTVTIMRDGKEDVVQEVDMTDSGFADDWMYFKAGNYNQNNAGDPGEYAQVSFFALDVKHFEPAPPSAYPAPSDIPRFQPFLAECKLQAPTSSTLAQKSTLNNGYTHPTYFMVADGDKILFNQSGDSRRTELRNETNWNLNDQNRSLHGRLDVVEQTCDQVTVLQIHDDANAGDGPNKPLLRIYKHNAKWPLNHIWAAIKTDDGGSNTMHVDLGEDPGGYFTCDIRLVDGNMIIDFEGEEKVNMDVSFWTFPSYWKAGAYLQDNGEATIYFDELFESDGSPQNYSPSIRITDPANGTNILPGTDLTINVEAEDADGSITLVEFFEGGNNKIGQDSTAPYSFTWENVAEGAYTLTATATDNEGVSRTSVSSNITVQIPVDVTGVALDRVTGPIAVGAVIPFEAVVSPADATNQKLVFETDEASIATVSETGVLTAISEGAVTLSVTTVDGGFVDSKTIEVLRPSDEFNWAVGQPAEGSAAPDGNNVEENLVDDNISSRWSVNEYPQSITVDLEGDIRITQTEVSSYEDRAYQFTIEGALVEAGPYTTLVDRSDNTIPGTATAPIINSVEGVEARYVRITVSGANVYTGGWVSLTELRIFGDGERTYQEEEEGEEEEGEEITELLLGPNPATSDLTIKAPEAYHSLSVFDTSGKKVIQTEIDGELILDISALPGGLYLVKIEGNEEPEIIKLIKW